MKKFTSTEFGVLGLGILLFIVGLVLLAWPREMLMIYHTNDELGTPSSITDFLGKTGSRYYGLAMAIFGAAMMALLLIRPKK